MATLEITYISTAGLYLVALLFTSGGLLAGLGGGYLLWEWAHRGTDISPAIDTHENIVV